ncbi:alpha-amylase family glycosyl hydrolase [Luteolibacter sp. Populi]|uniref:alpha-amylase family glycosyl hydrolase n=1 Tax=Luteolibacter sp. Populi TaxID=3230487 RepID=UPI003465ECFC
MRVLAAAVFLLLPLSAGARPWTEEVMYFALTDRFHDGDPANNVPEGSDPALYDPAQKEIGRYHGGDLRGLELAIRGGYFKELGVTALWITPPVRNVWRSGAEGHWSSGYHGYWAQDFLDIDPHLTSAAALDGTAYPEGAEGRMRHYRDFVALAHAKGLKVVQDVVLNHAGPVFYYDANGNGAFDQKSREEWTQPFKKDGYYGNAQWVSLPQWNMARTMPDGPRTLLGKSIATTGVLADLGSYGRKGFSGGGLGKTDGEEMECDFHTLRDLWTAPGSANFERLVDEFVEIHAFYLLEVGVDGLRVDTVKHVHREFWDAFTGRLRKRLGARAKDKLIFGEVYDGDPAKTGSYTWRADGKKDPGLDSVLDFGLCSALRSYLRQEDGNYGKASRIERAMADLQAGQRDGLPFYNPNPGADGKNAREKSVNFIENHDGVNRFRVKGVTAERNELAQALMLALPGIPCIYYGAETGLQDEQGRVDKDSESGRMTLFPRGGGMAMGKVREGGSFKTIARMAALRREIPALREGRFEPLWVDNDGDAADDGIFAFARVSGKERVMVVVNASGEERTLRLPTGFPAGTRLKAARSGELEVGQDAKAVFEVPAQEVVIYRVKAGR